MDAICPSVINSLVQIWTTLHDDLDLEIEPAEARYLRAVIFGLDDELVARLLVVKLAMSRRRVGVRARQDAAHMGSDVLYSVQGRRSRARLVYGAAEEGGCLGIATRFGAALLGMSQGRSILWPLEQGRLVEVRLLELRRSRRGAANESWREPRQTGTSCVSG